MNPAILLFSLVLAAAMSAFATSLVYAGLSYVFENSTSMLHALQDDMFASYRAARLDLAAGKWHRPVIAAAAGLIVAVSVLVVTSATKRKSTDARFLKPSEA